MKNHLSVFAISSMLWLTFFCAPSYAQTADNSLKVSGGEFGDGTTLVFPPTSKDEEGQYTVTNSDGTTTVRLYSNKVTYNAKERQLMVLITLNDGKGAGSYTLVVQDKMPYPPNAELAVQIMPEEGIKGHFMASSQGKVTVTTFGGPGKFVVGTFSGTIFEYIKQKETNYQVSGNFKVLRAANAEN